MWSASAQITLFIYTNESISVGLLWSARDIFDGETQADFTDKKRQDFTPISAGEYFIELSMLVKLVGTETCPASTSSCEISIFENLPQNLEQEVKMSIIIAVLSCLGAIMLFPVIVDCFTYKGLKVEEAEARDFKHSIMRLTTRMRNLLQFKHFRKKKGMEFDEGKK